MNNRSMLSRKPGPAATSAFPTHPFWLKHRSALARFSGHVSRLPSSVLSCFFSVVISSVSAQSLRHPAFVYPRNPAMLVMVHATSSRLRLPPALLAATPSSSTHQPTSQNPVTLTATADVHDDTPTPHLVHDPSSSIQALSTSIILGHASHPQPHNLASQFAFVSIPHRLSVTHNTR